MVAGTPAAVPTNPNFLPVATKKPHNQAFSYDGISDNRRLESLHNRSKSFTSYPFRARSFPRPSSAPPKSRSGPYAASTNDYAVKREFSSAEEAAEVARADMMASAAKEAERLAKRNIKKPMSIKERVQALKAAKAARVAKAAGEDMTMG